jgi:soluble lytic murein transglycosylase-like protein
MSKMKVIWKYVLIGLCFFSTLAQAGNQQEEALSSSVQSLMRRSVADRIAPTLAFVSAAERESWLHRLSPKLAKRIPDEFMRKRLLAAIYYEAARAGLDPQLVLGLIHVESNFRPYAISSVGARGLMQVMPFWQRTIGTPEQSLFDLYTNLRYGCTILRHYLDIERGNLFRALGRYNGSLGKAEYPNMVFAASKLYMGSDHLPNKQIAAL